MKNLILALLTFLVSFVTAELKLRPELDFRNKDFAQKDLTEMKELKDVYRNDPKDRAHFDGSNMEGVFLHKSKLEYISMKSVNLSMADLSYAGLTGVDLSNADLRGCNFEYSVLNGVDLRGAKLEGAKFKGAWISAKSGSHLQNGGVQWPEGFDWKNQGMWGPGVNLRKIDFTKVEYRANVGRWSNNSMEGADISGSSFANWKWNQFYLWGMRNIVAVGADFSNVGSPAGPMMLKAKGANFRNAKFVNCRIWGDYTSANFQGADFTNASFSGASFKRSNFTGVKWTGAKYDKSVVWPDGFDPIKAGLTLVE